MSLKQSITNATVSELALRPVITCDPNTPIRQALVPMRNRAVGCTIICETDGLPLGMFNEKILMRLLRDDPEAINAPIRDVMQTEILTLPADATVESLLVLMRENQLRWVCVVDQHNQPVGITGVRGIMEFIVDHFPRIAKVQNFMCRLALPQREGA